MAIYTKKGDKGKTTTYEGKTVDKDHPIVEAYGTIDELNSFLGAVRADCKMEDLNKMIDYAQQELFSLGAEISGSKKHKVTPADIEKLEKWIDGMEGEMPLLNRFIIPGGEKTAAKLHVARTVCRRAEREAVRASKKERMNENIIIYLNRLGDLLFTMARWANYKKRKEEKVWKK